LFSESVRNGQGQREINNGRVLRSILHDGPLSRVALARHTGLTQAAISNITRELIESRLLSEIGPARSKRVGAHEILLDLPSDRPLLGAVHQGVSALRVALCNLRGQIRARTSITTPEDYTPEKAVALVAQAFHTLLASSGYEQSDLVGVGAGLVGLIDTRRGIVKRAPRLGWEGVPFSDLFEQRFNCPLVIENNVRAMAFGEALFGEGRAWSDFALVYIGTGIGAGLIINQSPYRGAHDGAGEIGHITVEPSGEPCSCGNRGCLETIMAEPTIVQRAQQRGIPLKVQPPLTNYKDAVRELALRARDGDAAAEEIVSNCGESLGIALVNLVDLFNPRRIVLAGAITHAGDIFFSSVSRCIQQRAFLARDEFIELASPTFGDDAGLMGAAALALDAIVLNGTRYASKSRSKELGANVSYRS
jgi:N-acetylglucosamine repressor